MHEIVIGFFQVPRNMQIIECRELDGCVSVIIINDYLEMVLCFSDIVTLVNYWKEEVKMPEKTTLPHPVHVGASTFWGCVFLIFGFISFLMFFYAAVLSKMLPASGNQYISAIQNDRYCFYCFYMSFRDVIVVVVVVELFCIRGTHILCWFMLISVAVIPGFRCGKEHLSRVQVLHVDWLVLVTTLQGTSFSKHLLLLTVLHISDTQARFNANSWPEKYLPLWYFGSTCIFLLIIRCVQSYHIHYNVVFLLYFQMLCFVMALYMTSCFLAWHQSTSVYSSFTEHILPFSERNCLVWYLYLCQTHGHNWILAIEKITLFELFYWYISCISMLFI